MAKFHNSVSSNGKQTTSGTNTVISLTTGASPYVSHLQIDSFATAFHVLINNETTQHEIDAYSTYILDDVDIYKITIVESGVQYRYVGLAESV